MTSEFFRTARLIFRPFLPEDLDDLARVASDADVIRFTDDGKPLSRDVSALWIVRSRENVEKFGYGTGAVIERTSGRFVGWAGFARPEGAPEEIIFGFEKAMWGRGCGTEIVQGLIRFAFENLRLAELRATVHPDNVASLRILRKFGFKTVPNDETDVVLLILVKPVSPPEQR